MELGIVSDAKKIDIRRMCRNCGDTCLVQFCPPEAETRKIKGRRW